MFQARLSMRHFPTTLDARPCSHPPDNLASHLHGLQRTFVLAGRKMTLKTRPKSTSVHTISVLLARQRRDINFPQRGKKHRPNHQMDIWWNITTNAMEKKRQRKEQNATSMRIEDESEIQKR